MKRLLAAAIALAIGFCTATADAQTVVPISGLPAASAAAPADLVPCVHSGTTSKCTMTQVWTPAGAVIFVGAGAFGTAAQTWCAQDAGANPGITCNVPTASTNGFRWTVNNGLIASLSPSGVLSAASFTGSGAGLTSGSIPIASIVGTAMDLTTAQTAAGVKTFSSPPVMSGASISTATVPIASLATVAADTILANATGSTASATAVTPGALGAILCAPSVTLLSSGSGTYTVPSCNSVRATNVWVRIAGGGGGGGGAGTSAGAGGNGGTTTFGTTFLSAVGGTGGQPNGQFGTAGGTASGGNLNNLQGQSGYTGTFDVSVYVAGAGGSNPIASGAPNAVSGSGGNGSACGGGASGGAFGSTNSGQSAGAGGYVEELITAPNATYAYAVGAGGTAGAAGSGNAGGGGGAGCIIIVARWQ